jgi:hypothetical protein
MLGPGIYVNLDSNNSDIHTSKRFIPKKYYKGIENSKERKEQINSIKDSMESYKKGIYIDRPELKTVKTKKSNYIIDFNKAYGISIINKYDVEKLTGVTKSAQERILKKGKGAYYSSGSRPLQTSYSWAYGRLASVIMGGKARKMDQHILDDENIVIKKPPNKSMRNKLLKSKKLYLPKSRNKSGKLSRVDRTKTV